MATRASDITAWEKADIIGKNIVGIAGFALAAVIGHGEWNQRKDAERSAEARNLAVSENSLQSEFRAYYALARGSNETDDQALTDLDIASTYAQTLANKPFSKPHFANAVAALRARFQPKGRDGDELTAKREIQSESTTSSGALARDGWFAVIGTFSPDEQGLNRARAVAGRAAAIGCAEIWRAKSQNYAVVLGGRTTQGQALAYAARARSDNLAPDAFTQADKSWLQVQRCE